MVATREHDDHREVLVLVDRGDDELVEVLTATNPFEAGNHANHRFL